MESHELCMIRSTPEFQQIMDALREKIRIVRTYLETGRFRSEAEKKNFLQIAMSLSSRELSECAYKYVLSTRQHLNKADLLLASRRKAALSELNKLEAKLIKGIPSLGVAANI